MKLKRVKIFGFKTFAERTEFDLDGDLIAIVGPNGCGKSNIVDAILWGLGEPNARSLRASNSQEIIFNGSANRKPLGYAEVSLHFDNEDGSLPLDAPEVVITRRVNRQGDSEFEINRQRCRLKDIYDVLADSGLGRSGYAIVGQKEIDAALAASAEDRRAWIDEAAGVQKYRFKRIESLRRLGHAAEHIARVDDLLNEIESQREPLRAEAEAAQKYKAAQGALQEVETGLMMREVCETVAALEEIETRIKNCTKSSHNETTRAEKLEAEMGSVGSDIAESERKLDALRELQQSSISARDKAESNLRLAEQTLASLDELEHSLQHETNSTEERQVSMKTELESCTREYELAKSQIEELTTAQAGTSDEAHKLATELHELNTQLAEAREHQARVLQWQTESRLRKDRLRSVKAELEGIRGSIPDLQSAVAEAAEAVHRLKSEQDALRAHRDELVAKKSAHITTEQDHSARVRHLSQMLATLEGRKRGIESTIEAHEGLAQGSRAILAAVAEGFLKGEFAPVGEAIRADADLTTAIEVALGGAANDLICGDERMAKDAIAWLKERRMGRATFQPVTLMRPLVVRSELHTLKRERGIVGLAHELVNCDPAHRPVVDSILGRVLVCETIEDALRIAKTQGWSRLVTLDGEVVHSSGAVTGGHAARQGTGILARKAELEGVAEEIAKVAAQLEKLETQGAQHRTSESSVVEEIEATELQIRLLDPDFQDAHRWHGNLKLELTQTERSQEKLEAELASLTEDSGPGEMKLDPVGLEAQRNAILEAAARSSADSVSMLDRLRVAEQVMESAESRMKECNRRLEAEKTHGTNRSARMKSLEHGRIEAESKRARSITERDEAAERYERHGQELAEVVQLKATLLQRNFALQEQIKEAQKAAANYMDGVRRAEVDRVRAEARRASSMQRLLEEYGIDEETALEQGQDVELPEGASELVVRLRRELKSLGAVNLGAIDAFARLTERFDELNFQREDVLAGKQEIEAGIRELDQLTRERFSKAFAAVRDEFQKTIVKLFGGGEGTLSLTDPENLLETGVEVEVTVPGKRRQRLELLSGGERALAASAFLFALLRVKPSPFVVLDEVDAPLDGRNVERFLDAMADFRGTTQFLCITHNPLTIESAPIWFGVTMQEPGVSTVVPFRNEQRLPALA